MRLEYVDGKTPVRYRHIYIREIDLEKQRRRHLVAERREISATTGFGEPSVAVWDRSGSPDTQNQT